MEVIRSLIGPDDSPEIWQFGVRALIIFVFGIVCIRIAGRRTFSRSSPLDIVVAIVVGSNLSRAMTGKASFVGGLSASLVIVILHRALAMATLRSNVLARWIKSEPVVLVRNGVPDETKMKAHGISEADLQESLRLEKVEKIADAKLATLEGGGKISVIDAH